MTEDIDTFRNDDAGACPQCGAHLNGTCPASENAVSPRDGAFCLCIYCGTLLKFTDNATRYLRVSGDEIAAMPATDRKGIEYAQRIVRESKLTPPTGSLRN